VSGHLHGAATLPPGKEPRYPWDTTLLLFLFSSSSFFYFPIPSPVPSPCPLLLLFFLSSFSFSPTSLLPPRPLLLFFLPSCSFSSTPSPLPPCSLLLFFLHSLSFSTTPSLIPPACSLLPLLSIPPSSSLSSSSYAARSFPYVFSFLFFLLSAAIRTVGLLPPRYLRFHDVMFATVATLSNFYSTFSRVSGICCNVKELYSVNHVSKGVQYTGNAERA
jgi:hypothetical protein